MLYPFAIGDLKNSASVLLNYMENAPTKVPWEDLRYLFGEIMYGGHITDFWDRRVNNTYLQVPYVARAELEVFLGTSGFSRSVNGIHIWG